MALNRARRDGSFERGEGYKEKGEPIGTMPDEAGHVQQGSEEGSEALVQSQVRFNRVPEKVPEKVGEALVQSQVRFNRVLEKVAEPGQVRQGSGEGSRRRSGRLWCRARSSSTGVRRRFRRRLREALVQPGQVQSRSGRLWCRAKVRFNRAPGSLGAKPSQVQRVPAKPLVKVWEVLVQSQVRFNRVGSGEGLGGFGAERGQVQQVPEKVLEKVEVWEAFRSEKAPENVPENVPGSLGAKPSHV